MGTGANANSYRKLCICDQYETVFGKWAPYIFRMMMAVGSGGGDGDYGGGDTGSHH